MELYYMAFSTYKGIFKKRHRGNINLIIAPIDKSKDYYMIFVLAGYFNKKLMGAVQYVIKGKDIQEVLDLYKKDLGEKFKIFDKISVKTDGKKPYTSFSIELSHPGKYIKSNLKFTHSPNFSTKKIIAYQVDGEIDLVNLEIRSDSQFRMISQKNRLMSVPRRALDKLNKIKL